MKRVSIFILLLSALLLSASSALADQRAEEILKEVRTALGGDDLIQKVQGLTINGKYRRMIGDRQMAGDREISIGWPDKFFVEDAFSMGGLSTSMVNTRGLNGERAWSSSSGGGNMVFRMGGPGGAQRSPEHVEAMFRQQYAMEMTRYLLAILAAAPPSSAAEFKYVGDSDVDDIPADVLEVSGPNKLALRVFFDKKSRLPLLLSYRGPRPRVVTMTRPAGGTADELKKAREEAEKRANAEAQAEPEQADFFIRIEDHKKVNGLLLPHKFTFLTDAEVSEEFEISKYQVNPQFKADRFQKH
jgi:hypothetical protein